ncbi:MAG: DUF924 family protein [Pontibacterium sp.]
MHDQIEEVITFWLGELDDGFPSERHFQRWWHSDGETYGLVSQYFHHSVVCALGGDYASWEQTPRGRLALIVLLDQMTRVLFRGQAQAFSGDKQALRICLEGISQGADKALLPGERWIFYKPLEHSESLQHQQRSLSCYEALFALAPPKHKVSAQLAVDVAWEHLDQVQQFGRFPRRNHILNRDSTEDELLYLGLVSTR